MGKFVAKAQFSLKGGVRPYRFVYRNKEIQPPPSLLLRRNEESVNDFYGVIFNNGRAYLPTYLPAAAQSLSLQGRH